MGKKRNSCYTVDQASSCYSKLFPLASFNTYRETVKSNVKVKIAFKKIQVENIPDLTIRISIYYQILIEKSRFQKLISFIILSFCLLKRQNLHYCFFISAKRVRLAQNPGQSLSSSIITQPGLSTSLNAYQIKLISSSLSHGPQV